MHILDIIIYFISVPLIWLLLGVLSKGELTEELGGVIGTIIIAVYTIIYVIIFGVFDVNWSDLQFTFGWLKNIKLKW